MSPYGNDHRHLVCKFSRKCLVDFDSALCCKVKEKKAGQLVITPVSTFKSSNCSHKQSMLIDGDETFICTCPVRREIYETLGK